MRLVFASDSLKGTISSAETAELLESAQHAFLRQNDAPSR